MFYCVTWITYKLVLNYVQDLLQIRMNWSPINSTVQWFEISFLDLGQRVGEKKGEAKLISHYHKQIGSKICHGNLTATTLHFQLRHSLRLFPACLPTHLLDPSLNASLLSQVASLDSRVNFTTYRMIMQGRGSTTYFPFHATTNQLNESPGNGRR